MKTGWKAYGLHHVVLVPFILALLDAVPDYYTVPTANALYWFGKELGEAVARAGGTRQAFKQRMGKDFYGRIVPVWEHMDWVGPSLGGFILWPTVSYYLLKFIWS